MREVKEMITLQENELLMVQGGGGFAEFMKDLGGALANAVTGFVNGLVELNKATYSAGYQLGQYIAGK